MAINGYAQYQQNQFLTASPAKLLLAAYDGAIRFCRVGAEMIEQHKYESQGIYINKALAIVCELLATLREDVDPVLVGRLKALYKYVIEKLTYANLNSDVDSINEAIKILSQLRETWADAEKIILQEAREAAA